MEGFRRPCRPQRRQSRAASQAQPGTAATANSPVPTPASAQPATLSQVPPEVQDLFTPAFAALPTDERLNRITAKLKQLNPGFDGVVGYKKNKSEVTGVSLPNAAITNLWPLCALVNLKTFYCKNSPLAFKTLLQQAIRVLNVFQNRLLFLVGCAISLSLSIGLI